MPAVRHLLRDMCGSGPEWAKLALLAAKDVIDQRAPSRQQVGTRPAEARAGQWMARLAWRAAQDCTAILTGLGGGKDSCGRGGAGAREWAAVPGASLIPSPQCQSQKTVPLVSLPFLDAGVGVCAGGCWQRCARSAQHGSAAHSQPPLPAGCTHCGHRAPRSAAARLHDSAQVTASLCGLHCPSCLAATAACSGRACCSSGGS